MHYLKFLIINELIRIEIQSIDSFIEYQKNELYNIKACHCVQYVYTRDVSFMLFNSFNSKSERTKIKSEKEKHFIWNGY